MNADTSGPRRSTALTGCAPPPCPAQYQSNTWRSAGRPCSLSLYRSFYLARLRPGPPLKPSSLRVFLGGGLTPRVWPRPPGLVGKFTAQQSVTLVAAAWLHDIGATPRI